MRKFFVLGTVMAMAMVTAATGCVVRARPATVTYSYGGYTPYYYYGNLVYFDGYGRPYYYRSGMRVWVPRTWVRYNAAVNYYRVHRVRYRRWHTRYHRPRYYRRAVRPRHYRRRVRVRSRVRVRRTRRVRVRRTRRRRY